jgi:ADP-ribose pyrophosphatase YjhB (NUDIX family)
MDNLLVRLYRLLPWPQALVKAVSLLIYPKYCLSVAALIRSPGGEILLAEHTYRDKYPWGIPTGVLKRHESPEEALRRELYEELGVQVTPVQVLLVRNPPGSIYMEVVYECALPPGQLLFRPSTEVSCARFFPLSALPEALIEPEQLQLIRRLTAETGPAA